MRIILDRSVSTVKRLRVSLGTLVAIEATADSLSRADAALETAFEAISDVDRRMHPRNAGSDLARIHDSPLHVPTKVHPSVGQLLKLARRIHELSEGTFDPCLPTQPGRLGDIVVSDDETEIVCHATVALDFGGFAKGYAVDCAVEAMIAAGCTAGLVNAGGDLRVFGPRTEPVFVRGPAGELTNIELADGALAVSDASPQQQPLEHQGYYDRGRDQTQLDPLSAAEVTPTASPTSALAPATPYVTTYAAVIASTALIADALTKCVLLCPPHVALRTLRAFGATHAGDSRLHI